MDVWAKAEFRNLDTGETTRYEHIADDWHCLDGSRVEYRSCGPFDDFPGPWRSYGAEAVEEEL